MNTDLQGANEPEDEIRSDKCDMSDDATTEIIPLANGPSIESLSITPAANSADPDTVLALPPPPSVIPGVIGLQNIGNTCFMNSVLQCLLHCRPLCDYFLSDQYKDEINDSNPLGTGGKLVGEFAKLIERFWRNPTERTITPRELKFVIGQHQPMFVGYQQQDSQELVTFLLDGLHEDLNLVKKKPYTEAIEANDRPDDVVAKLCWDQHLLRNKSKIVDIFQGQYKSRLRCPHCSKSSVTFDPFMYLSLPIPSQPDLPLLVTFSYPQLEPAGKLPPIRLAVNVFRDASDLSQAIAAAVSAELPPEYSDTIVTDDIVVFSQSTTFSCFQVMDGSNFYATSSLAAKKRVFCSFAPKILSVSSPSAGPSSETPMAKRQKNNSILISVQTRICPRTKWTSATVSDLSVPVDISSTTVTPTLGFTPVGCPSVVALSSALTVSDLISLVKRTVIYSVGPRSKDLFEGIKNGAVVRVVEHGATIASIPLSLSFEDPKSVSEIFSALVNSEAKKVHMTVYVDIPIEDKNVTPVDEDEDNGVTSTPPMWDDIVSTIQGRIGDYYKTEPSWKHTSVMGLNSSAGSSLNRVSISDCFRLFSSEEVLGSEDQWYCGTCKIHVQASKKIDLWSTPEVLIVHLKRFQYARGFRNKIESTIDFPCKDDEVLDLAEFMPPVALVANTQSLKYKLFGISNHMGSLYSGHYTAYAKLWEDESSPTKRRQNVCV